jgi:hypothetical protein
MAKLDRHLIINGIISLFFVFVAFAVYRFTNTTVDEGTWVILFMLIMIFFEVTRKKG